MDISINRKGFTGDNQAWLGSAHGTNTARTITLDLTSGFAQAEFYKKGFIPSGTPVTQLEDGLYGLYTESSQTPLAGFILTPQGTPASVTTRISAPLLEHGRVIEANLPVALPARGKTEATHIIFV